MKRTVLVSLALTLLAMAVAGIWGCSSDDDSIQMVNIDGLKYYLYPTEAIIDNGNTWSGDLVIPSEVKHNGRTLAVRGMAYAAFKNCTTLTKVRIPNTIVHIVNHNLNGVAIWNYNIHWGYC